MFLKKKDIKAGWDQFRQSRTYRKWCDQAETGIVPTADGGYAILTDDGLYRLEMIEVDIQGWCKGMRADDPYADNFSKYTAVNTEEDALEQMVMTVVRYRYEMKHDGSPSVDWSRWMQAQYSGVRLQAA